MPIRLGSCTTPCCIVHHYVFRNKVWVTQAIMTKDPKTQDLTKTTFVD